MSKITQKTILPPKKSAEMFDEYPNPYSITQPQFREILKVFNTLLMKSVIDEGAYYTIPPKLGFIGIFKKKTNRTGHFNYQHWKETGEKVYIKNKHSAKFCAQIKFVTRFYSDPLWEVVSLPFTFIPTRQWNRYLARQIIEQNTIHLYYDNELIH